MKYILALIASLFISHGSCQVIDNPHASGLATNASSNGYKVKWNVNPFDQKIFIENQGQFDVVLPNKGKVLFGAELGQIKAFFTANGLTYRYDEYPESKKENEEKEELEPATFLKHKTHYLAFTWEGANPNVTIQALGKRSDYYVYPTGLTSSVQVNLFKKIIYRNLYPGIDIEYIFPDGKEGIKYSIIVHPGGDPSKVKLKYIGAKNIKKDGGNVTIQSEIGEFIDHTPYSFYEGEEGINIQTKYKLNDNEESFLFEEGYDKTKTLVIDPWITTPIFPGAGLKRGPWDVDYDYNGNVYAASQNGLVKLNSSGSIIWTYQVSPVFIIYGEITVDRATGNVFIVGDGGISPSLGIVQKISTNGLLIASNSIAAKPGVMREFWRAAFNQCTNQLIIGAGGLQDIYQAGTIDINLTQFNLVNVMNLPINTLGGYDMVGVSIDPSGTSCYMANSSQSPFNTNTLIKLPCPAISPTSYNQPNGYIFGELNHNYYGSISSNGMNVIAAGNNGVYMWDGYTLKQFNKATGALITSNVIQTPVVLSGHVATRWAGIDVDACEKIYAGYQTSIKVFNSSLLQTNVITLPNNLDTVNDVAIGVKGKTLYACGTSFVTSIEISGPATDSITKATTQATCSCNGTATATFLKCGSPLTSGVTYLWSNGQTTQTATGLCAGIHNITLNYNCKDYRDTVMISAPGNIAVTSSQTNVTCNAGNTGNANVNVSGGLLPYTYSWSGGAGTSPNANNLTAGNYTVTVTDANGCKAIKIVGIDQPDPLIANLATTNNSCSSTGSATLYISNNAPYTYTWSTSQTGTSIGGLIAGTYTLTVNSSNGCSQTKIFSITGTNPAFATFTQTPTNVCINNTVNFKNTGSSGSGVTHSWTIKEIYGVTGTTVDWSYTFLSAGTYSITHTVTNAGCTATVTSTVTVINCSAPTVTAAGTPICPGECATVTSIGTGGTTPYTYSWSNGSSTQNINPCPATTTTYTVTIQDKNGTSSTSTAVVTVNPAVTASTTVTNITCSGSSNGTATGNPGNGTPGYAYSWSNGSIASQISNLTSQIYTVTITDSKGCSAISTASIVSPPPLKALFSKGTASCISCGCKEWTMVNASGGTSPYSYSWPDGYDRRYKNHLCPGAYTINIKDKNGCSVNVNLTAP